MGRVIGHIPQGQPIPGTGQKHKNGRVKKGTETVADVPHISVDFQGVGIKHVPAVENVTQQARQQAESATSNPRGMKRAKTAGVTASYIAGRQSLKPKLDVFDSPNTPPETLQAPKK